MFLMGIYAVSAQALEPWELYDDFNSKFIDEERWSGDESKTPRVILLENVRHIEGQRLRILNRSRQGPFIPPPPSPPPTDRGDNNMRVPTPLANYITAIKVSVKVNDVESIGCPDTTTWQPTRARARLVGSFFNTTGVGNTGQQNDVIADIIIQRFSDSPDKPQVLKVIGEVLKCIDSSCFNAANYQFEDLGDIMLGQWANIEIVWDKPNKTFFFKLNRNPPASIVYTGVDNFLPNAPFKLMGVSQRFPFCPIAGREAFLDVDFENVFINESAFP